MKYDLQTIEKILKRHKVYLDNVCDEYGERGYTKDEGKENSYILFANWNPAPKHVMHAIEQQFMTEWSDEWVVDYDTGKCYRCVGDSYSWKPYYYFANDCEVIGGDYVEENFDAQIDYIETLIDNPEKVNLFDFDLSKHGFENLNGTFQNGFHRWMTDDPTEILERYQEMYPDKEFIFGGYLNSQFYCEFEIWGRNKKEE